MSEASRKKHCVVCQEVFVARSNRQKYCLEHSSYTGVSVCRDCGNEFKKKSGTTGQFCSRKCGYAFRTLADRKRKPCLCCNKTFKPRHKGHVHCSKYCASLTRERRRIRTCPVCWKTFDHRTHPERLTCSRECAAMQRRKGPMESACQRCGKTIRRVGNRYRQFCSKQCLGVPVGSRRPLASGYVQYKVGKLYSGTDKRGWILEHRHVMEQHLGRRLEAHERVHHKNGNRADNRPDNLELWKVKKKDPAGVRAEDYHCAGCQCLEKEMEDECQQPLSTNRGTPRVVRSGSVGPWSAWIGRHIPAVWN